MKNDTLRDSIYSQKHLLFRKILISQRKSLNLSQKELAEKLGVHHSVVGKIEIGDRRLEVLEFINYCKALNINPCSILKSIQSEFTN